MGIVNVTPDSFSDGGLFLDAGRGDRARPRAGRRRRRPARHRRRVDPAGAPGGRAPRRSCARVAPVLEGLGDVDAPISIDTSKAAVAEAALDAGAEIVNDVTALRARPRARAACAPSAAATVVLMHMLGTPRTMQDDPAYDDVVDDVRAFLAERIEFAVGAGDRRGADLGRPGDRLRQDGRAQPRAAAPARRAARARPARSSSAPRARASSASSPAARSATGSAARSPRNVLALRAGADVLRVHDVAEARQALVVAEAILDAATAGVTAPPSSTPRPRAVR